MRGNQSIAWHRVGRVLLVAHSPQTPSDEQWAEFMSSSENVDPTGVVVIANGVKLTSVQRGELQEHLRRLDKGRPQRTRSAVLTDSVVSRGVVTALSWFGIEVRAFPLEGAAAALDYAGVPSADVPEVLQVLEQLQAKFPKG